MLVLHLLVDQSNCAGRLASTLGWLTVALMVAAAIAMFVSG